MTPRSGSFKRKVSNIVVLLLAVAASPVPAFATNQAQKGTKPTTDLEQVIAGLPWAEGFQIGAGVDALTGGVAGTAIEPPTLSGDRTKSSRENVYYISSEQDFNREIEASVSGKYNIEPGIAVTASTSYLNNVKYSENSTTLIAKFSTTYDYDDADNYQLKKEAQALLRDNPEKFRRAYGDYFVAAVKRGARFVAVYNMTASSSSVLNEFKASLGGEAPDLFTAEGKTRFMQESKNKKISYRIEVFMEGYTGVPPGGPWTPEKVYDALDFFKANISGIPLQAKLKHYSTVDPSFDRTIPVDPNVFVELSQLYLNLWEVRSLYASLPVVYQRPLSNDFVKFDRSVMANRHVLCTDLTMRGQLASDGTKLLSSLRTIAARRDFFEKVRNAQKNEPGTGTKQAGRGEPWLYGYASYDRNPVAVQINKSAPQTYKEDWHVGWRENTLRFGPDPAKLIVGWQVISNWGADHNGDWWKESNGPILLGNVGSIRVKSEYDRGTNWTVIWYTVDAQDYLFD